MKRHILPALTSVASVLIGLVIYRVGGSDWLFIYAGFGGPFLMAFMWTVEERGRHNANKRINPMARGTGV